MLNNKSLRFRVTLISALILLIVTIIISVLSIHQADNIFIWPDYGALEAAAGGSEDLMNELLLQEMDKLQTRFRMQVLAIMFVAIVTGIALISSTTAQIMRPLHRIVKNIEQIDETKLNSALPQSDTQSLEIRSLSSGFNRMLAKLERAFQTQKRFSQNIAHELKTPLASMMMQIDVSVMDESNTAADYRRTLEDLQEQVERMNSMVSSMLALHARNDDLELTELSVRTLFDRLIQEFQQAIQNKGLELNITGDMRVTANAALFERALSNLLQNAIRYSPMHTAILIELDAKQFSIQNHTTALNENELEAIFEPFYCAEPSRSKASSGFGLGLSITKQILEEYGLRIRADFANQMIRFIVAKNAPSA